MHKNVNVVNREPELGPLAGDARQVTVTNAVTTLGEFPKETTHVYLQVQAAGVRVEYDGSDPTLTKGFIWLANQPVTLGIGQAKVLKLLRSSGTDSVIHVQPLTR